MYPGELEMYTAADLHEYSPQELSVDGDGDAPMPSAAAADTSGGVKRYRYTKPPAVSAGTVPRQHMHPGTARPVVTPCERTRPRSMVALLFSLLLLCVLLQKSGSFR